MTNLERANELVTELNLKPQAKHWTSGYGKRYEKIDEPDNVFINRVWRESTTNLILQIHNESMALKPEYQR